MGDNYCDDQNNNAECNFDDGDCCDNDFNGWVQFCSVCACLETSTTTTSTTLSTSFTHTTTSSTASTVSPFICGDNLSGPSGLITSPNSPNDYPHNARCLWQITCKKEEKVEVTFNSFDVEFNQDNCQ